MTISDKDISFLRLLLRSPDIGDGWRKVSKIVWPLIDKIEAKELFETKDNEFIRLSDRGLVVIDYI